MDFVMRAAFLEGDVWERRLRDAAAPQMVDITECNSTRSLLAALELKPFSLLTVILDGAEGIEAVQQIRLRHPGTPLLWISDEDYSLLGYRYHVTYFLRKPVDNATLREAVKSCLQLSI